MCGSEDPFSNPLTVLTALSTNPLLCGYLGLLVTWWKPYSEENCLKVLQLNCGPLSVTSVDGIPCHPKIDLRAFTIVVEVVLCS